MSDAEQNLIDYLHADLIIHKHQLATYRRAFGAIAIIGIAFLACVGSCLWSIYSLHRANSEIIQQAIIAQSIHGAMCCITPKNTDTLIEILPDGKVALHDTNNE